MKKTAVYRHYDKDENLLYIGISSNPFKRMIEHNRSSSWATESIIMRMQWFSTRDEAIDSEREAIKKESPLYNIVHTIKDTGEMVNINAFIELLFNKGLLYSEKIESAIAISGEECCTCQDCGRKFDDCVCEHNDFLAQILSLRNKKDSKRVKRSNIHIDKPSKEFDIFSHDFIYREPHLIKWSVMLSFEDGELARRLKELETIDEKESMLKEISDRQVTALEYVEMRKITSDGMAK